jgi:hypothetical protein
MEGLPAIWDTFTLMMGRDWGKIERDRARGVANCLKKVKEKYERCRDFKAKHPQAAGCLCDGKPDTALHPQ